MARSSSQAYLDKLNYVIEAQRFVDLTDFDGPPDTWSRAMKSRLTRAYNEAQLATATDEIANQKDYVEMLRLIRPFAKAFSAREGYRLDNVDEWSPAKKAKLTKYFKKGVMLASKQFELYRTNDPESMEAMRELAEQKGYPEFKQVFYPAPPGTKIHYDKRTGIATATADRWTTTLYLWEQFGISPEQLAADPVAATKAVIEATGNGKRRFSIKAGAYSVGKGVPRLWTRNQVAENVRRLVEKYGADAEDPNDPNSSYFGNWLVGIEAWDFSDRRDEQTFVRGTRAETEERRRIKRSRRKRLRYQARKK